MSLRRLAPRPRTTSAPPAPGRPGDRGDLGGPGRPGTSGRWFWPTTTVLATVLAVVTHLPAFTRPLWNPDEAFLAVQGQLLEGGGVLYQTVVDRKPAIAPYLYAFAYWLTGHNAIWTARGIAILCHVLTALLLALLARRRWGDRAGLLAAFLYVVASIGLAPPDAQAANFETFMLPSLVGAMVLADGDRPLGSGFVLALSTLTKQLAAFTVLPILWVLTRRKRRVRTIVLAAVGGLVPFAVLLPVFGWHRFTYWVFTGSGSYLTPGDSIANLFARGFGNLGIVVAASVPLFFLTLFAWPNRREDADLWIWLASAFLAIILGFHFFGHYYLQLLPPFVLLATGQLHRIRLRYWGAVVLYGAASVVVFLILGLVWPRRSVTHDEAVAAAVRAHTDASQPIFVWGMDPYIYWASGRRPATRFLTAQFLTNWSGGRNDQDVGEGYVAPELWKDFTLDLERHPPALVVDDSQDLPYRPANIPRLEAILDAGYERIGVVDGAVLYQRIGIGTP